MYRSTGTKMYWSTSTCMTNPTTIVAEYFFMSTKLVQVQKNLLEYEYSNSTVEFKYFLMSTSTETFTRMSTCMSTPALVEVECFFLSTSTDKFN